MRVFERVYFFIFEREKAGKIVRISACCVSLGSRVQATFLFLFF
jgi:hypothetical protein